MTSSETAASDLGPLGALGALAGPLARTLARGRPSPAYLLEGSDAAALRAAAKTLAAAILCPHARLGCTCASCARAQSGRHPDLHVLRRDRATVISVPALEPVLASAHRRPLAGERQVFIVDPADALEPAGVARYLKTLEEPPEGTVFLLLTTRPERLPDTVKSRCRRLRLPPLAEPAIAALLVGEGVAADRAARAARHATGSLDRARRMAEAEIDERLRELVEAATSSEPRAAATVEAVLALLDGVATSRAAETEDENESDAKPAEQKREALRATLQDLLHALGVEARDAAAGRPAFGGAAVTPDAALDLLETAGTLGGAAALNVNPAVVLLELVRAVRAAARG